MDTSETNLPKALHGLDAFKQAFRRHAAGVAVVTARTPEGEPVGFTATSLASLAAVPPLASFNMSRVSSAWPAVENTDYVIIHMLGTHNRDVAELLAGPKDLRFDGDHWSAGPHDIPLLKSVRPDCRSPRPPRERRHRRRDRRRRPWSGRRSTAVPRTPVSTTSTPRLRTNVRIHS